MRKVPDGWVEVALGDIADTALGKMLDRARTRGLTQVPYLRNVNVQWGRIDTDDLLSMELADDERSRFEVVAGDLLVCEGGEIGRCAIWPGSSSYIAYQKALHRIRPGPKADSKYLRYLLEYQSHTGLLASHSTGSTIRHLPQQQLRRVPVPLAPIEEQWKIVGILEDHLSRLDTADVQLRSTERKVDAWVRAALDRLLWSVEVDAIALGGLLSEPMRNGHSARASTTGAGIRTLTLTAVTKGDFTAEFTKVTTADPAKVDTLWLRHGDILVERSNTPALVGTAALYDGPDNWAIFPDLLIRLRVNEGLAIGRYVVDAIRSERAHQWLRARAKGLAGSMPKIDQGTIAALRIPVPTLEVQRSLVAQVAEVELAADRARRCAADSRRRSAGLRASLLEAAFSGRLVTASRSADLIEEFSDV